MCVCVCIAFFYFTKDRRTSHADGRLGEGLIARGSEGDEIVEPFSRPSSAPACPQAKICPFTPLDMSTLTSIISTRCRQPSMGQKSQVRLRISLKLIQKVLNILINDYSSRILVRISR